ncbi:MAG: gfo/Idh/MocA family oxidoreductase, partial [Microbacteriaceae bacterium]|nr:gfo/Idh/MocA family oxidoreductase [Microbacteriaceae bacterium]
VAAGRKNRLGWEINGARGSLAFDLERPSELRVYFADGSVPEAVGFQDVSVTEADHPFAKAWWPRGHVIGWEHAHVNELNHLLECIARDTPVGPYGATFEDGYRNAVICDAVQESAQRGVRVAVSYEQ